MNFNDLNNTVQGIASFFNLNVKLINLDENKNISKETIRKEIPLNQKRVTIRESSDTDDDIEEIFGYEDVERKPVRKSRYSKRSEQLRKELNELKEEQEKMEELMKDIYSEVSTENTKQEIKNELREEIRQEKHEEREVQRNIEEVMNIQKQHQKEEMKQTKQRVNEQIDLSEYKKKASSILRS